MSASGGPLRVGVIVPVTTGGVTAMADALTEHHDVAATLAVSPQAVSAPGAARVGGEHLLDQLAALGADEVLDQPYVPIDGRAVGGWLANEIGVQVDQGDEMLRAAGLKPYGGPWVDTASTFSQGDGQPGHRGPGGRVHPGCQQ